VDVQAACNRSHFPKFIEIANKRFSHIGMHLVAWHARVVFLFCRLCMYVCMYVCVCVCMQRMYVYNNM